MKTIFLTTLAILLVVLISGCASIMHGSKQEILFVTSPDGATIDVQDSMDVSYGTCETPCSLKLERKREYKVFINKDGFNEVEMILKRGSDGWIWGNIFFGGIIGLIVDFSNGSAYKLSPAEIQATMSEETASLIESMENNDGIVFVDFSTLSPAEQESVMEYEKLPLN